MIYFSYSFFLFNFAIGFPYLSLSTEIFFNRYPFIIPIPKAFPIASFAANLLAKKDILFLDKSKIICDHENMKCFGISNNLEKYFYDYGHFTMDGATFFGKRMEKLYKKSIVKLFADE